MPLSQDLKGQTTGKSDQFVRGTKPAQSQRRKQAQPTKVGIDRDIWKRYSASRLRSFEAR